ncbi:MAG TPA: hypothetical protein GX742_01635 [Acholeplasmataceae bacterium]|nr:hypothetical protein [Acholeplasmataceae bacterium]
MKNAFESLIKFPNYILFHPFDGYEELKRYKKGKLWVAFTFIALFLILRVLQFQYNGFIINDKNIQDLNSLLEIFSVGLIIVLFVVGNWSVTTLMEGKGNWREIILVVGYSLFPVIIIGYPGILLSNLVGLNEVGLYSLIIGISWFAAGWMLFMGILNVHEYGLLKTIAALLLTIVSMLVMVFVGILFFDLIQQFITFIRMIWQEINLRI